MIRMNTIRRFALAVAASAVVFASLPASAQDISDDHIKAARAAVAAIKATDPFDGILPEAAAALKQSLIQKNPDMQEVIIKTIDEKTLALAPRRADLEKEAALAYAKGFSDRRTQRDRCVLQFVSRQETSQRRPDCRARMSARRRRSGRRGVARDLAGEVGKSARRNRGGANAEACGCACEEGQPAAAEEQPAPAN